MDNLFSLLATIASLIGGLIALWIRLRWEFKRAEMARISFEDNRIRDAAVKGNKLEEIHVLVNDRLSRALDKIDMLEALILTMSEKLSTRDQKALREATRKILSQQGDKR